MPYTADISRNNPGCFLFLIDHSGSMYANLSGQRGQHKCDQAADAINRILDALSQRCSQGMEVRDYFDVGIITYDTKGFLGLGGDDLKTVFPGSSLENPFLPISRVVEVAEIVERQVKESDGDGGLVEVTRKVPVWLQPEANGGNPICSALTAVSEALKSWIPQHSDSFPPIVIHVTDGEYYGEDPEPLAREIMSMATNDGNVLLFNIHLSEKKATPVQFPDRGDGLPNKEAELLFRMSSVLPGPSCDLAGTMGLRVTELSRGFVFNSDMVSLVQFLDIGTRGPANLR